MHPLLSHIPSLDLDEGDLEPKKFQSGCLSLYSRRFFPWGGLPYPKEHAEVGLKLAGHEGFRDTALKMAEFQQATFDHNKKPIFSFLRQEESYSYKELMEANRLFFESLNLAPKENYSFVDRDLGVSSQRGSDKTVVILGSGCKSGLGVFLYKDIGVLNFGPELLPIGESSSFGLSGRAKNFQHHFLEDGFSCSFQSRLSAPHSRDTKIFGLLDSGYSGLWMKTEAHYVKNHLTLQAEIEGFRPVTSLAFSFFCKAENTVVAKSHKLKPKSLDRYMGPPDDVELKGKGSLFLRALEGFSKMEIIPLAGDESFWGADFLIAFFVQSPKVKLELFF